MRLDLGSNLPNLSAPLSMTVLRNSALYGDSNDGVDMANVSNKVGGRINVS